MITLIDCLDNSSSEGGNKPDPKGHVEALRSAWCSATSYNVSSCPGTIQFGKWPDIVIC